MKRLLQIHILEVRELCHIKRISLLAENIWYEHYVPIIGKAQVDYMVPKFQSEAAISNQIEEGMRYFIVYNSQEDIGYFAIDIVIENSSLFISKFYIAKEFRGQGVARACLSYMENICRKNRLDLLWLTVNKYNNNSIRAYEKMGFNRTKELVADIGSGYVMDDYKMEKRL